MLDDADISRGKVRGVEAIGTPGMRPWKLRLLLVSLQRNLAASLRPCGGPSLCSKRPAIPAEMAHHSGQVTDLSCPPAGFPSAQSAPAVTRPHSHVVIVFLFSSDSPCNQKPHVDLKFKENRRESE